MERDKTGGKNTFNEIAQHVANIEVARGAVHFRTVWLEMIGTARVLRKTSNVIVLRGCSLRHERDPNLGSHSHDCYPMLTKICL